MEQQEPGESCCVPPGFRFHPTEEELVGYYLARKVASRKIDLDIIQELDLYRIEPWDLQERCSGPDEQMSTAAEWYFFSYKDRKYPSGTRTNRATAAGFWKATGRDKPVVSSSSRTSSSGSRVIGMRKTLVFYKGRAPNGSKTDWIMHEYRLVQSNHHHATIPQEEGWVVCRAFHKPIPNQQRPAAGYYYHDHLPNTRLFMGGYGSSSSAADLHQHRPLVGPPPAVALNTPPQVNDDEHRHLCFSLPQLVESPSIACAQQTTTASASASASAGAIDWNFLDTLLSQLHEPSAAFLQ